MKKTTTRETEMHEYTIEQRETDEHDATSEEHSAMAEFSHETATAHWFEMWDGTLVSVPNRRCPN